MINFGSLGKFYTPTGKVEYCLVLNREIRRLIPFEGCISLRIYNYSLVLLPFFISALKHIGSRSIRFNSHIRNTFKLSIFDYFAS